LPSGKDHGGKIVSVTHAAEAMAWCSPQRQWRTFHPYRALEACLSLIADEPDLHDLRLLAGEQP
jgi:hypothetical protein